jgi:hypothetical protein
MSNPAHFNKLHGDVTDALVSAQKAIGAMGDTAPPDLAQLDQAITDYLAAPHAAPEPAAEQPQS